MKKILEKKRYCLLPLFLISLLSLNSFANTPKQPNIILILLDDLSWRDVGFMENNFIETPSLDHLASEGMVFTHAYSSSPNCAPSRAAIMSGLYSPRTEVYTMISGDMGEEHQRAVLTPRNKMYLESQFTTMAEALKDRGYATAHIGKWNLGTGKIRGPEGQGFDLNIAGYRGGYPHKGYFAPYDLPGLEDAPEGEYLTDRLSAEASQFIAQNHEQPFFIYLSHFAPHYPLEAPAALEKKYYAKRKRPEFEDTPNFPPFAAMIESVDQGVGKIYNTLKQYNLDSNTLIVFTSDNGGYHHSSNMGGLRGGKSSLYEGGIRVPLFFWWPGTIVAGESQQPVIGIDFFPTFLAASDSAKHSETETPALDGENLLPLLRGDKESLPRQDLFWYFPAYTTESDGLGNSSGKAFEQEPAAVIQREGWKLIRFLDDSPGELYYLPTDISEQHNLITSETKRAEELSLALDQWLQEINAPLSLPPNPTFSPTEPSFLEKTFQDIIQIIFSYPE